jgi:hypothetical protein
MLLSGNATEVGKQFPPHKLGSSLPVARPKGCVKGRAVVRSNHCPLFPNHIMPIDKGTPSKVLAPVQVGYGCVVCLSRVPVYMHKRYAAFLHERSMSQHAVQGCFAT